MQVGTSTAGSTGNKKVFPRLRPARCARSYRCHSVPRKRMMSRFRTHSRTASRTSVFARAVPHRTTRRQRCQYYQTQLCPPLLRFRWSRSRHAPASIRFAGNARQALKPPDRSVTTVEPEDVVVTGAAKIVVAFTRSLQSSGVVEGFDPLIARNGIHPAQRFPKVQSS